MIPTSASIEVNHHTGWGLYEPHEGVIDHVAILTDPQLIDLCYAPAHGYFKRTTRSVQHNRPTEISVTNARPYQHWVMLISVWPSDDRGGVLNLKVSTPSIQVYIVPQWAMDFLGQLWLNLERGRDHQDMKITCTADNPWFRHEYVPTMASVPWALRNDHTPQLDQDRTAYLVGIMDDAVAHWPSFDPLTLIPDLEVPRT